MKRIISLLILLIPASLYAQNDIEKEVIKTLIIDNFSRPKDTLFYKNGRIKKIKYRQKIFDIAIQDHTILPWNISTEDLASFSKESDNLFDSSTFTDLIEKGNISLLIDNLLISPKIVKISYIDSTHAQSFMSSEFWGQEIVLISRVGFNKKRDQALVYFSQSSCNLCGEGFYSFYQLKNGKWYLIKKVSVWIS